MRKVLITAIVILSLILAAMVGFIWYQSTHIFVEGEAYAKYADPLDLRERDVTESRYLAVQAELPGRQIIWNVPFQGGHQPSDSTALTVSTLTEEDIRIMTTYFRDLKTVDAGACRDYAALAQLAQQMPGCAVTYQIDLGGATASPDVQKLILEPGSFDFDLLLTNLTYLTELQSIHFPKAELDQQRQAVLAETYPDLAVTSTVEILGKEYDETTTVLDLSSLTAAEVESVAEKLAMLTGLTEVKLSNALTLESVQKLNLAAPEVAFQYSFDFYGNAINTMDQEVILKNIKVENDGFAEDLRMLLDVLENCDRFVLESRGQYDAMW